MVKQMISDEKSEETNAEWHKFAADEAGLSLEEYRKRITEQMKKMNERVERKEHQSITASISNTKELAEICDVSTYPGVDVFTPEEMQILNRVDPVFVVGKLIEHESQTEAELEQLRLIERERLRLKQVEHFFRKKAWEERIIRLEHGFDDVQGLLIRCVVKGGKRITLPLCKMFKLGFVEWSRISELTDTLEDYDIRMEIKREAVYLVNVAFQFGFITSEDYQLFCTSNNVKLKSRSLGLDSTYEGINPHPVPKEVCFANRMYVKTENHEGLCYLDHLNEECFQDMHSLSTCSLSHCIALLKECEDEVCAPFRKRLISWMFNNLLSIKRIHGTRRIVELVSKEYQMFFNKSDAEMRKLIKYKYDRLKEFKNQS